ncbi:MAG TPA: shikimate dehydrogenase, partial [Candidatus Odoribacter faecigallinarum]|nr:shikimate dehydrogenase [Candidatus Odoribacter faecigallinarum]
MRLYGIIGYPIAHSRSPEYFNELFRREGLDARYLPFELEDIHGLPVLLDAHPDLCGFNVTIPHKTRILPYLDNISAEAAAVGAVNCVRIERTAGSPHLYGYNTDV